MVSVIMKHSVDPRVRMTLMILFTLAAYFLLASCSDSSGLYQGGGDSEPNWR